MAYADLDNDGDLDLVINNVDDAPFIYKNNAKTNFLRLILRGGKSNPFGYGAKATIYYNNGEKQVNELSPTRGFLSSSEPILHFGLGKIDKIDKVEINWNNGKISILTNIKANQVLTINEKDATDSRRDVAVQRLYTPNFTEITHKTLDFKHQESDFNDFKKRFYYPINYLKWDPLWLLQMSMAMD